PFAGAQAADPGGEDLFDGRHASGQVGHLDRGDRRRTSIRSDSVQQTGYGRVIDVVARPGSHRAMLAVSGEGTVDQAGMDLAERLRIQAEPGHHARPEAL